MRVPQLHQLGLQHHIRRHEPLRAASSIESEIAYSKPIIYVQNSNNINVKAQLGYKWARKYSPVHSWRALPIAYSWHIKNSHAVACQHTRRNCRRKEGELRHFLQLLYTFGAEAVYTQSLNSTDSIWETLGRFLPIFCTFPSQPGTGISNKGRRPSTLRVWSNL